MTHNLSQSSNNKTILKIDILECIAINLVFYSTADVTTPKL